jgi:uncharacterized protein with PIN domain
MNSANFYFLDELNDFLAPARRGTAFDYPFAENPSAKHLIEALGVPHTEVASIMGFDTLYRNNYQDDELTQITEQEGRILLTRDRRLLMRKVIIYAYCIRSLEPKHQTIEVLHRYDLFDRISPFQRCLRCNHPLQPVSKEAVVDRLEPLTKRYYHAFHLCPACNQVYWKGSHYERMQSLIDAITRHGVNGG